MCVGYSIKVLIKEKEGTKGKPSVLGEQIVNGLSIPREIYLVWKRREFEP